MHRNIVYKDNQSSMLLEWNGRGSNSNFFVTDRIGSKEMEVEYCPMEDMTADFFTKPLQGALFRKL